MSAVGPDADIDSARRKRPFNAPVD